MEDRDTAEPLLRDLDRASASPPSPRRTSDADYIPERSPSGGSDGPVGGIYAAMRKIERMGASAEVLPGVVEVRKVTVSVFYWSLYSAGESYAYTVELQANHTVKDLIQSSLAYFASKASLRDTRPESYLLRAADKKTMPKTHFPAFGLNQAVIDTRISRFSLCSKKLDEEAKRRLLDEEDIVLQPLPGINAPADPEPVQPARRRKFPYCCPVS